MSAVILMFFGLAFFYIGLRFYSKYLARRVFKLDENFVTPAHEFNDGVDFVPTNKHVLFGHHFTSVAGAAPILGPAIAAVWGWLPALIWIVFGTVLAGAVHDFGTLWVSTRNKGKSIGNLAESVISSRARVLFLLIIFFLIVMINAVFALAIANLFNAFKGAVVPIAIEIPLAVVIGFLVYKRKVKILIPSLIALAILYLFVYLGQYMPISIHSDVVTGRIIWIVLLFTYAFIAASLPVWVLLQPRDYINSHQLFVALGIIYSGLIIMSITTGVEIAAPMYNPNVEGAPSWFPLLFVTIACGAISGFHGLVSSGTTSKQLNKETDARYIGYGGAIGEGSLALAALLACVAGLSAAKWGEYYGSWASVGKFKLKAFVEGGANFASAWGIPPDVAGIFVAVIVISFAATTMDTSVRLLKYIIAEIGKIYKIKILQKGTVAALIGVLISIALALHDGEGKGALAIWPLFGTTNQLTAGLSLLVVGLYLKRSKRPKAVVLVPMVFLLLMTSMAMFMQLSMYLHKGQYFLLFMGSLIFILEIWLILEAVLALRSNKATEDIRL